MEVAKLNKQALINALPMVWKVFCEFEAVNYSEENKQAFWNAIHQQEYIDSLTAFGAFIENNLVGIIATRNNGGHIALFFVDGNFQNQGIGKTLFNEVLKDIQTPKITAHSSIFAAEIYRKLGFVLQSELQNDDGIQFIPMEYTR